AGAYSGHRPDPARPREAGLPLRAALRARQAHALREHAAPQGSAAGPQGGLLPLLRGHAMPEPLLKVRNLKKYFPIRGGLFSREVAREQARSEEHTCELQSLAYLVCRL